MREDIIVNLQEQIEKLGGGTKNDGEYVFRSYLTDEGGAFFGMINKDESSSGKYHDLSLVVFPTKSNDVWVIAIGVGTLGFKEDFQKASKPGLRRMFLPLLSKNSETLFTFIKSDTTDLESPVQLKSILVSEILKKYEGELKITFQKYSRHLPILSIIKTGENEIAKLHNLIGYYAAIYAKHIRNWPSNKAHRDYFDKCIKDFFGSGSNVGIGKLKELAQGRKFIILQGAPGVGKTRKAKELAKSLIQGSEKEKDQIFFTQFHAETSFSDFVGGIKPKSRPNLKYLNRANSIQTSVNQFEYVDGILARAVKKAMEIDNNEKVVLIIDEINRANLPNVLGPCYYLFEPFLQESNIEIEIVPGLKLSCLPENLYIIGTMNTSDKNLASVDIALRRRFAWITLHPIEPKIEGFEKDKFKELSEIFDWYATEEELALKPGHGYFITKNGLTIEDRLRYEILPLIKEYLSLGFLLEAKEELNAYFTKHLKQGLYA